MDEGDQSQFHPTPHGRRVETPCDTNEQAIFVKSRPKGKHHAALVATPAPRSLKGSTGCVGDITH